MGTTDVDDGTTELRRVILNNWTLDKKNQKNCMLSIELNLINQLLAILSLFLFFFFLILCMRQKDSKMKSVCSMPDSDIRSPWQHTSDLLDNIHLLFVQVSPLSLNFYCSLLHQSLFNTQLLYLAVLIRMWTLIITICTSLAYT